MTVLSAPNAGGGLHTRQPSVRGQINSRLRSVPCILHVYYILRKTEDRGHAHQRQNCRHVCHEGGVVPG